MLTLLNQIEDPRYVTEIPQNGVCGNFAPSQLELPENPT
jgi:hypothetical protein